MSTPSPSIECLAWSLSYCPSHQKQPTIALNKRTKATTMQSITPNLKHHQSPILGLHINHLNKPSPYNFYCQETPCLIHVTLLWELHWMPPLRPKQHHGIPPACSKAYPSQMMGHHTNHRSLRLALYEADPLACDNIDEDISPHGPTWRVYQRRAHYFGSSGWSPHQIPTWRLMEAISHGYDKLMDVVQHVWVSLLL